MTLATSSNPARFDPEDPDSAAAVLLAPASAEQREEAAAALLQHVNILAARAAQTFAAPLRLSLADDAMSLVLERLEAWKGSGVAFVPWFWKVFRNRLLDLHRRCRRERRWLEASHTPQGQGVWSEGVADEECREQCDQDGGLDRATSAGVWAREPPQPFSRRQSNLMESLPPLRRIIALATTGWWPRASTEAQARWRREARLSDGFPPPELHAADDHSDRRKIVGQALQMSPATVRQHWCRALPVLRQILTEDNA